MVACPPGGDGWSGTSPHGDKLRGGGKSFQLSLTSCHSGSSRRGHDLSRHGVFGCCSARAAGCGKLSAWTNHRTPDLERTDRPGKTRTWWHPLLVRLFDHALASAYTVRDKVLVGKLPLRVDILLIRREAGELAEASRRDLSALIPLLNRFTLIEFKGPTDALEPGDLAQLVGCSFLWHSQQTERVPQTDVSLIVLAPILNDAAREELRCLGWEDCGHEAGVYRVVGGPFTMWLVETDVMAERGQPILSLVSGVFLNEHRRIIEGVGAYGTFGTVALRASAGGAIPQVG